MHVVRQSVRAYHRGRVLEYTLHVVLTHLEVTGAARLQALTRFLLGAAPLGRMSARWRADISG